MTEEGNGNGTASGSARMRFPLPVRLPLPVKDRKPHARAPGCTVTRARTYVKRQSEARV